MRPLRPPGPGAPRLWRGWDMVERLEVGVAQEN